MSETLLHDIYLDRFRRRMLRINLAAPWLQYVSVVVPSIQPGETDKLSVSHTISSLAPSLFSSGSYRSRLPQVLAALQKWPRAPKVKRRSSFRAPIHREFRPITEHDPIFRSLQSLLHRALDSNVGRRA
jgi:hypothetical protein